MYFVNTFDVCQALQVKVSKIERSSLLIWSTLSFSLLDIFRLLQFFLQTNRTLTGRKSDMNAGGQPSLFCPISGKQPLNALGQVSVMHQ